MEGVFVHILRHYSKALRHGLAELNRKKDTTTALSSVLKSEIRKCRMDLHFKPQHIKTCKRQK